MDGVSVLDGRRGDGLTWKVFCDKHAEGMLSVMVRRTLGDFKATSGFMTRPGPFPSLIKPWMGRADGLPLFILAVVNPEVVGIHAVSGDDDVCDVPLSPVIEAFGVRFAATPIPDYVDPTALRVVTPEETRLCPMRMPRRRDDGYQ